jgi:hypothetical protein
MGLLGNIDVDMKSQKIQIQKEVHGLLLIIHKKLKKKTECKNNSKKITQSRDK